MKAIIAIRKAVKGDCVSLLGTHSKNRGGTVVLVIDRNYVRVRWTDGYEQDVLVHALTIQGGMK